MKTLSVTVTTLSSLYIGGMPKGFEIGGIDMQTATQNEKPYIPASSFKGALRDICRDNPRTCVSELYKDYEQSKQIEEETPKHLFLFGIQGVNRSPKIIFTDLALTEATENCFSIESKNSITEGEGCLESNPRTYRVARSGLIFEGQMYLNFDELKRSPEDTKSPQEIVEEYLVEMCNKFAEGVYRIGNSKSRGYGHVDVAIN